MLIYRNVLFRIPIQRYFFRTCSKQTACLNSSISDRKPYFITTPIFYVNAAPHIGHVYTAVIADAAARFRRLLGSNTVLFSTGTDEHGLKIQQAAQSLNQEPAQFCDSVSETFRQAFNDCEISYTDFVRTTDHRHVENVQHFWELLAKKGYIYKGKYEGWYCTADETFVSDDKTTVVRLPNGQEQRVSLESNRSVEWSSEENYMFKLSQFKDDLNDWLQNRAAVQPDRFYNLLKMWLKEDLEDLSISRPKSRLSWGIPVPGDDSQTIYVWLDALLNYLTVAKQSKTEFWPPTVHVIGKDILKFHGIYWPAFLLAADLTLPKGLLVHGHWLVDDEKMSKSSGNVVHPKTCIDHVSATGFRYFLLHEGVPATDGNFSSKRMVRIVNSELADGLGNLVSRCCGKSLNPSQTRPAVNESSFLSCGQKGSELLELLQQAPENVFNHYHNWEFYKGIDAVMALVRGANGLFHAMEPWKLNKQGEIEQLNAVMGATMECSRIVGILLQPIIPSFTDRLLNRLGVPEGQRSWEFGSLYWSDVNHQLGADESVLFPRVKS